MALYRPLGKRDDIQPITVDLTVRNSTIVESRDCFCVTISGRDYDECKNATYWASQKTNNKYGKAQPFPDGTGDIKAATGLFGEIAVAIFCGLDVDFSYRKGGDSCDFLVEGKKWEVKTAMRKCDGPKVVAKWSPFSKFVSIKDLYILCYVIDHDVDNGIAKVAVVGHMDSSYFKSRDMKESRKYREDEIINYDVFFSDSEPLEL